MTAIRFLHTADVHLGKPFGGYPASDRLRVARQNVIGRLIAIAREHQAPHILVAGDLFETPNPAAQTWRQMATEMAEATDLTWWLLPGNHDNLREAQATWDGIEQLGHANLRVLFSPDPAQMQDGVFLLPAPLATRHPTEDPTGWMDTAPTPDGAIRIGLAHGSIKGFSEGVMPADVIAPDRDQRARLDYLALGDWHGFTQVSPRTAYSGAPERTGFKHNGCGICLIVDIDAATATPRIHQVPVGVLDWQSVTLDLLPGDDPHAQIRAALPDTAHRDMLVKVAAQGRLTLGESSQLAALEASVGPEFCHFELETSALQTEIEAQDLEAISIGGALRTASDALAADANSATLSEHDRDIAAAALRRLHAMATEDMT
ncbi:DNA repair exonuclease [Sulfitobacter sp. HNIBRBA2951]|uniref:metallophosphoesterase family protein n=1 Tax=Sulfitobacter aquimarinus TaxID=3158557 RepID=UPI0032DFA411